jgi:hypothetical protein
MATAIPLNTFRTEPVYLTTQNEIVYTTPVGFTTIVLGAQISNQSTATTTVNFTLTKNGLNYVLLKEFEIPPNDAADATTGKLVIEENAYISAQAGADGVLTMILSILETSNV